MRHWYRIEAKTDDPSVAELFIYDDIGKSWWDDDTVTAVQFIHDLRALAAGVTTLNVRVNSLGGDPFDAFAIANALRDERMTKGRTVHVWIDGIAASAASVVIMAGDSIRIADNGLVMIHDPFTIGLGNATEFRKLADNLDTIRDSIVATYRWRSELSEEDLRQLMAEETWMDADEAIARGFATEKVEGVAATARFNGRALARLSVPEKYRTRARAVIPPAPARRIAAVATDVLRICRDAGCVDVAESLIVAQATLEEASARAAVEKHARDAETARVTEIRALCRAAKLTRLADGYVNARMPLADVKSHLTTITALLDDGIGHIDSTLEPDGAGRRSTPEIDVLAIYKERNRRPEDHRESRS